MTRPRAEMSKEETPFSNCGPVCSFFFFICLSRLLTASIKKLYIFSMFHSIRQMLAMASPTGFL